MTQDLQKICIPSGPSEEVDLLRAKTGLNYAISNELDIPFKILGAGPDLEQALQNFELLKNEIVGPKEYERKMAGLDHHLALYQFLVDSLGTERVETVTDSVTLVQNVLYGFQGEQEGRYGIVTEPWHYKKFQRAEDVLKRKGRISQDLEFFNIPSPDTGYYTRLEKIASGIKTGLELMRV